MHSEIKEYNSHLFKTSNRLVKVVLAVAVKASSRITSQKIQVQKVAEKCLQSIRNWSAI